MSYRRIVLLMASVVAAAGVAVPAAATVSAPVVLSGTVAVQTVRSAVVDVLIPEDAEVSLAPGRGVAISGRGRLVGLWLQQTSGGTDFLGSYRLPVFAGGRQQTFGSARPGQCKGTPSNSLPVMSDCTGSRAPKSAVLSEGHYRMTVLTDGSPLRITLRLTGLAPRLTTVRPSQVLASTQKTLPARESVPGTLVTFGAATTVAAPTQTFVLATARRGGAGPIRSASQCERPDSGAAPFSFGPHCPGGVGGGYQYAVSAGGQETSGAGGFASSSSESHRGPLGLGGAFGDSAGVTLGSALGVWLERP